VSSLQSQSLKLLLHGEKTSSGPAPLVDLTCTVSSIEVIADKFNLGFSITYLELFIMITSQLSV